MRLIDADALIDSLGIEDEDIYCKYTIEEAPTIEAQPVVHGEWILEAHKESCNYRWNVTAQCSECCDEVKEIWAGFFPGVPDYLAENASIQSAESVQLSNFCPNCGAKMDGKKV